MNGTNSLVSTASIEDKLKAVKEDIQSYPDFPKPGILFRDIFSVLGKAESLKNLKDVMVDHIRRTAPDVDVFVGLESRGFLFGTFLALEFGASFVPVRKKGKLPGKIEQMSYTLEYGVDTFEIQADSICPGQKVLIVDDLIATGGTLEASYKLVSLLGGEVIQCFVVIELVDLKGREKLTSPFHSLFQF